MLRIYMLNLSNIDLVKGLYMYKECGSALLYFVGGDGVNIGHGYMQCYILFNRSYVGLFIIKVG